MEDFMAQLPSCAVQCMTENLKAATCATTNDEGMSGCVCQDMTLLSNLFICVQKLCGITDQALATSAVDALCATYPKPSRAIDIQIVFFVTVALSTPVVLVRCAARLQSIKRMWVDDWVALLGMILLNAFVSVLYISSKAGLGLHYWDVSSSLDISLLQFSYIVQLLYLATHMISKVSIACFFMRLFSTRWIRSVLQAYIIFLFGHGLVFMLVAIFQCWPLHSLWDPSVPSKCLNIMFVGFADAGIGMAEDVFLVLMSTVELHKLEVARQQRIILCAFFAMAISAMLASAMRLKHLLSCARTYDATWNGVDLTMWSAIELLLTVLIGSLPSFQSWNTRVTTQSTIPDPESNNSTKNGITQESAIVAANDDKNEYSSPSMVVYNAPPRFSSTTKTTSFTMSVIPSIRSSDYWEVPEPPLMIPTSKFQDSAVALPHPTYYKRWSQQPDSPTDPNVLAKYTSLYLTRVASEDLESNCSRDTWILRDSYSLGRGERLSSRLART